MKYLAALLAVTLLTALMYLTLVAGKMLVDIGVIPH